MKTSLTFLVLLFNLIMSTLSRVTSGPGLSSGILLRPRREKADVRDKTALVTHLPEED